MKPDRTLIVFCHLRWDFVFQRPQHLITRFAAERPVLFIEEPLAGSNEPGWDHQSPARNLVVCRPRSAVSKPGFVAEQLDTLRPMIEQLIEERAGSEYDVWFYTPMALPFARGLKPRTVIYDKMDDLASFKFAPPELRQYEAELLELADVVFTGGPSLYRSTRGHHPNCHCFPSSVDSKHFGKAAGPLEEPTSQSGIPHPRLG
jgi:UDP-galactopyranose mutase